MRASFRKSYLWVLKNTLNRVTIRVARAGGGPFSLIRHVGRRSGRTYETPVVLAKVPEGFVTELTYGENVNWFRNVEAAGGCIVVYGGEEYRVDAIEPCDAATGRAAFPTFRRAILTATRRKNFRLLRTVVDPAT
ncbi:MAG: nitroreductase family deazaflavin-dependent oxidoreductase [Actinobacteria bacterium]|nr:nitroreductase family deazaflavin-dependent oxidoreductase [Actinomycetota bacterium]